MRVEKSLPARKLKVAHTHLVQFVQGLQDFWERDEPSGALPPDRAKATSPVAAVCNSKYAASMIVEWMCQQG